MLGEVDINSKFADTQNHKAETSGDIYVKKEGQNTTRNHFGLSNPHEEIKEQENLNTDSQRKITLFIISSRK